MKRIDPTLRAAVLSLLGLAGTAGCYDDDPERTIDIVNEDISLYVRGENDGTQNHLAIALSGPGAYLKMSDGDRFFLRVDGAEVAVPEEDTNGFRNVFLPPESASITAVLARETDDSVEVDIPVILTSGITAAPGQSRATGITFTWQPTAAPDARLDLSFGGPCLGAVIGRTLNGDPGQYTLQPADFVAQGGACTIAVTLRRQLERQYAPSPFDHTQISLVRADELTSVETLP